MHKSVWNGRKYILHQWGKQAHQRLAQPLHGVGCLVCHHERTRLTSMDINMAIIVRRKSIKKISIKSHFVMEKFVQTLKLTEINPILVQISNILCIGMALIGVKSKRQMRMSHLSLCCTCLSWKKAYGWFISEWFSPLLDDIKRMYFCRLCLYSRSRMNL